MAQRYSPLLDSNRLPANDLPRRSSVVDSDSDSDSDIVYRDQLDIEPFAEKGDTRFQDEPSFEDGMGSGSGGQSRRPSALQQIQGARADSQLRPRKRSKKILAVLIGIVGLASVIGALSAWSYSAPSYSVTGGNKHITMDHVFNGTFAARSKRIDWVKEAPDGTFSHIDGYGNIVLNTVHNIENGTVLVKADAVLDSNGERLHWQSWSLSADMEYVLFKTDNLKQWRHSSFGNYWVYRRKDSVTFAIVPPSNPPTVSLVSWSPVGHGLAFVNKNDLYVLPGSELGAERPEVIRVTDDGSAVVFNGVPDWVYEEEVFSSDSALWWSPDGNTVAYLRSDEAAVPDYKLQYYNPSADSYEVHPYPTELDMKYPKPGFANPLVTIHTFSLASYLDLKSIAGSKGDLTWPGQMPLDQRVIMEVGWVADDALMVKEIDRAARNGSVVMFQNGSKEGKVVRSLGRAGEEGDEGWIDHGQNVIPVKGPLQGYLDLIPKDGYDHIAFFSPLDASEPIWITSGEWEVTAISGVDESTSTVYYMAANPSIDRYLYSSTIPHTTNIIGYDPSPVALTDPDAPGYYEVSFSPGSKYYVLSYKGPQVPWQRLKQVAQAEETDEEVVDTLLEGNGALNDTLAEFMAPIVTRSTFLNDGYELNMLEILPPGIDTSGRKKYPVLFRVYGGPGSQLVSHRYERDWQSYLACEKKYITIIVDGRGTGFKGRAVRNPVIDNLGNYEVQDQIAAAREVAKRVYVDHNRIGIWGWSYGGFMTCKTIEADSGVFTLGMAVAPVTNWLYYDSIYTERYMSLPSRNAQGYNTSAVNNVTAFGKVDFLLAHGSGDDNVHYMNSASLLDKFTQKHVRGWRFRMFTDSNHNMDKRDAYRELYQWMTDFLDEKWGRGGRVRGVHV